MIHESVDTTAVAYLRGTNFIHVLFYCPPCITERHHALTKPIQSACQEKDPKQFLELCKNARERSRLCAQGTERAN